MFPMMSPGMPGQQQGNPAQQAAMLAMLRGQQGAQMPQGMSMQGGMGQGMMPGAPQMGQPMANPSPMGSLAVQPPQGMAGAMPHPMMQQPPLAGMSPQNATPQQFANLLAAIRGGAPGVGMPGQTMGQPAPFGMVAPGGAQQSGVQQGAPQPNSAMYALMQAGAGAGGPGG